MYALEHTQAYKCSFGPSIYHNSAVSAVIINVECNADCNVDSRYVSNCFKELHVTCLIGIGGSVIISNPSLPRIPDASMIGQGEGSNLEGRDIRCTWKTRARYNKSARTLSPWKSSHWNLMPHGRLNVCTGIRGIRFICINACKTKPACALACFACTNTTAYGFRGLLDVYSEQQRIQFDLGRMNHDSWLSVGVWLPTMVPPRSATYNSPFPVC